MTYTSQYPPAQNTTYVKATTSYSDYDPWEATDPTKSVTGGAFNNSWSSNTVATNQRFHIDLGTALIIKRIYLENFHDSGGANTYSVKNFTFWGSNEASAFAELTYATDTNWTQLTTIPTQFTEHPASDTADPQYATVTNSTAYRYYALKFADCWTGAGMGVRRIELQTGSVVATENAPFLLNFL
jgi:hypothetical protein